MNERDPNYCDGCGAYAMHPVTHGGKNYCPKCYAGLNVVEEEPFVRAIKLPEPVSQTGNTEPEGNVVPLEAHLVVDDKGSWSLKRDESGTEWYTDGTTHIRRDVFEGTFKQTVEALGVSDHIERDDSVNIPLPLQKKLLHASFYDTILWLQELLEDDEFMQDLEKMCDARLEQAHPKWGSTMYAWDSPKRWRAIMEELSDVFVYRSSEV